MPTIEMLDGPAKGTLDVPDDHITLTHKGDYAVFWRKPLEDGWQDCLYRAPERGGPYTCEIEKHIPMAMDRQ